MVGKRFIARIVVLGIATAGWLVPYVAAPARTIRLPETIARSVTLSPADRATRFAFAPTHIAFSWVGDEGTGVRYRTTSRSGAVSRWFRAPEAHDAERGDRHFSGVLSVHRPVSVEYEAIARRDKRMGKVTLDYLNTIDGPLRAFRVPLVANAAETPPIVTRAEWGADESLKRTRGGCKRKFFDVQQLFVHHTAGKNNDTDPAATMRAIYWYHTQRQGWCDVGYNFVIAPDGTIFEGRWARKYAPWEVHSSENLKGTRAVAGAHVSGFNSGSIGISLMGNFSRIKPPPLARQWLTELLAWEADRHDLDPVGTHRYRNPETGRTKKLPLIAGHRDAGSTACPGGYLYRQLGSIRQDTATVMGPGKATTRLGLLSSATEVPAGTTVALSGRLRDLSGAGLFNHPITLYQRRPRGEWSVAAETTTGLDGSFSFSVAPAVTMVYRAVYLGDATNWGSQSRNRKIRVTAASPSPTS